MVEEVADEVELLNWALPGKEMLLSSCLLLHLLCLCSCAETSKARLPAWAGFLRIGEGIHFWSSGSRAGCCNASPAAGVDGRV